MLFEVGNSGKGSFMNFMDILDEPKIIFRLSPDWTIGRSHCGRFLAVAIDADTEYNLTTWVQAFDVANPELVAGASLSGLRELVLTAGNEYQAGTYLDQIARLNRMGLIEYPIYEDGNELATIIPQRDSFVPSLAPSVPDARFEFHHLACLRREGACWLAESPLSAARFRVAHPSALERPLVRRALYAAGFLEAVEPETVPRGDILDHWEFHDLIYHAHSRRGWHRDPSGAHCPLIGIAEPAPVRRPDWPGNPIVLPDATHCGEDTLATVLERRRSEREWDEDRPITIDGLGALLDRAARSHSFRVRSMTNNSGQTAPIEVATRPSPSAGAVQELEIYPVVRLCEGLEPGIYHYDSWRHTLLGIPSDDDDVSRMLRHAKLAMDARETPQLLLVITARFPRVFWKYKSIGYGNILRNTGALYQTLYLAATELGLAACAVGSADSMLFAHATGLDPFTEGTVGEFVIGSKPSGG